MVNVIDWITKSMEALNSKKCFSGQDGGKVSRNKLFQTNFKGVNIVQRSFPMENVNNFYCLDNKQSKKCILGEIQTNEEFKKNYLPDEFLYEEKKKDSCSVTVKGNTTAHSKNICKKCYFNMKILTLVDILKAAYIKIELPLNNKTEEVTFFGLKTGKGNAGENYQNLLGLTTREGTMLLVQNKKEVMLLRLKKDNKTSFGSSYSKESYILGDRLISYSDDNVTDDVCLVKIAMLSIENKRKVTSLYATYPIPIRKAFQIAYPKFSLYQNIPKEIKKLKSNKITSKKKEENNITAELQEFTVFINKHSMLIILSFSVLTVSLFLFFRTPQEQPKPKKIEKIPIL